MSDSLQAKILKKCKSNNLKVFSYSDFLDLGKYDSIRKAFQRLKEQGEIKMLAAGIYYLSFFNKKFNMWNSPKIDDVANTIARKHNWNIAPSGNATLNLMGLSTQVPSRYIYISDGPYRKYKIENIDIYFKHSSKKEISNFSYKTRIVIQAIKAIGKSNLDEKVLLLIGSKLNHEEKIKLLEEGKSTNIWIYESIKKIVEGNDV